jgi:hypothetical protein
MVFYKAKKAGVCTLIASYNGEKCFTRINVTNRTGKINITIRGKGKVTKSPDKDTYEFGDIVTLTAIPDDGWGFFAWGFQKPFHSEKGEQIQVKFEETVNIGAGFGRIINFPDQNFESEVRNIINKPSGPIIYYDVFLIKFLDLENKKISNLEGLQYFENLEDISLRFNNITYIPDLSPLGVIKSISLSCSKIEDISSLANLRTIRILYLDHNRIKDIGPLKNLTNLQTLFLSGNEITDYSPIADYYPKLLGKDFTMP